MLFSPTIGAAIAALLAYGRLRCRDQTATRRHYQTIAPANNRIHPAHSRHRLPRRHPPDAIRPFYHRRTVHNYTQRPALNSCWPCLGRGSEFRPTPHLFSPWPLLILSLRFEIAEQCLLTLWRRRRCSDFAVLPQSRELSHRVSAYDRSFECRASEQQVSSSFALSAMKSL